MNKLCHGLATPSLGGPFSLIDLRSISLYFPSFRISEYFEGGIDGCGVGAAAAAAAAAAAYVDVDGELWSTLQ